MSLKVASSTRRRWLFPGAPTVVSWPVIWLASTQGSTRPAWLAILSSIWPLWFAALTSQTGTSWHAHSHTHAHICLLISWLCQLRTTTQHLLFYHLYPCSQIWQLYASKWDKGHVSTSLSRKEVFNNAHWVILFILSFCWCSMTFAGAWLRLGSTTAQTVYPILLFGNRCWTSPPLNMSHRYVYCCVCLLTVCISLHNMLV